MILRCILIVIFGVTSRNGFNIVNVGPNYPPTKGEVWPKPQQEYKENTFYTFDSSRFKIKIVGKTCDILVNAVQRYLDIFKKTSTNNITSNNLRSKLKTNKLYLGTLKDLQISLSAPCEEYPHSEMDEVYFLSVSTTSVLISKSIWGTLRGLETFAQLLYLSDDRNEVYINSTDIFDYPLYKHRGLLLDTSRHYISLSNILKTIDAMAINKMNVFHWHIVDDQSFPYQSKIFPELSEHGAYNKLLVYTKDEIKMVVEYAKDRGIRVIPEIDVPGHTTSWGNAHPSILTDCYYKGKIIGKGPMDPTYNGTYILLKDLLKEVQTWFPDKYIHLGGDEVQLDCWESNPKLRLFMKKHKLTPSGLHAFFLNNTLPLLAYNTKSIVWQEVFDEGINIPKDTLIHVWKDFWIIEILKILLTGYKVIFSSTWYLSNLNSGWYDLYAFDPRQTLRILPVSEEFLRGIVGGEACMWGEMVDDNNILSRVWPRASAVAEKLWSSPLSDGRTKYSIPTEVYHRKEEHTCRMVRRGINAQPPNGPSFCIV